MSDEKHAGDLEQTLQLLTRAIERLNGLVEGLSIELTELAAEECPATDSDTSDELPVRSRERILH